MKGENQGTAPGSVSQAWIFRCAANGDHKRVVESTQGRLSVKLARHWTKEAGWTEKQQGGKRLWFCPRCSVAPSPEPRAQQMLHTQALKTNYCECAGPLTRSSHVPDQPSDSELCAACWYNDQHPEQPLLTLHELDELDDLEPFVGRLVDWHCDVVPLVRCTNGAIRLAVMLSCRRCGSPSAQLYAGSGLHSGAWPYIYDAAGTYLACIRDQEYVCPRCTQ